MRSPDLYMYSQLLFGAPERSDLASILLHKRRRRPDSPERALTKAYAVIPAPDSGFEDAR